MFRTALGLLFALLVANAAAAAPITYLWDGVVDHTEGGIVGAIQLGDTLHVSYTFDADPGCPYGCAEITHPNLISASASIGPYTYTSADDTVELIVLDNDPTFAGSDVYEVHFFELQGPALNGLPPLFLELDLIDGTHTAFPSSELDFDAFLGPKHGFPSPRSFDFYFAFPHSPTQAQATGPLLSLTIVPEADAPVLASIAFLALLVARGTLDRTRTRSPEWMPWTSSTAPTTKRFDPTSARS